MRIVLTQNRFIRFINQTSTSFQLILFFILTVSTACFWWRFCYLKLNAFARSYSQSINKLNRQKSSYLKDFSQHTFVEKEVTDLTSAFNSRVDSVRARELYTCLNSVVECINKHNVKLVACNPLKGKDFKWYKEIPFSFIFEANFNQIIGLFNCLTASGQLIECNQFEVKKMNDKLKCTCTLNFLIVNNHD